MIKEGGWPRNFATYAAILAIVFVPILNTGANDWLTGLEWWVQLLFILAIVRLAGLAADILTPIRRSE